MFERLCFLVPVAKVYQGKAIRPTYAENWLYAVLNARVQKQYSYKLHGYLTTSHQDFLSVEM